MEWNRQTVKSLLLVVCGGVAFYCGLQHLGVVAGAVVWLLGILSPFVLGGAIAFVLNVPMRAIERHLFPNRRRLTRLRRPLALVLTLVALTGVLTLAGASLVSEQTKAERRGGRDCTVLSRLYQLEDGKQAEAITAQPAAYIERLSEEGFTPQLITGFVLAGMDAVYAVRGEEAMLCAREGETVYLLLTRADEQTLYALGASAGLE